MPKPRLPRRRGRWAASLALLIAAAVVVVIVVSNRTTPMPTPIQRLAVTGMTCNGCVNAVSRVLSHVPGAAEVRVSLDSGRADVSGTANPTQLLEAVRKAGFGAELLAA